MAAKSLSTLPQPANLMEYVVKRITVQKVPTAVVRSNVKDFLCYPPDRVAKDVLGFISAKGMTRRGGPSIYFNQGLVEIGVPVSEPFIGNDTVHCSHLPAGCVATTYFRTSDGRQKAHLAVRRWCAENGYQLSYVVWEIFGRTGNPPQLRVDLFYLLDDSHRSATEVRTIVASCWRDCQTVYVSAPYPEDDLCGTS